MHLRADLSSSGWLVLGEWDYPGWRAFVNGQRQRIYRADYSLRAVPLDPGTHEIELVYRPVGLYVGAALSALTLLIVAVFLALGVRSRDA
jgi:uncharacterized membrane protein YfhO